MNTQIGGYLVRDFVTTDAAALAKHADNRKIWRNVRDAFPSPYRLADAERFIASVLDASPPTVFAIATPTEAIGAIGLTLGQDVHRFTAELGYWLAEPYWGRGITSDAVRVVTAWGIRELSLKRVYAEPYAKNAASARVLEKAGFTREGVMRSNVYKDGELLDQFLFSYIDADLR